MTITASCSFTSMRQAEKPYFDKEQETDTFTWRLSDPM